MGKIVGSCARTATPDSVDCIGNFDHILYPKIAECLKIFFTLPVTTWKCERNAYYVANNRARFTTHSFNIITRFAKLHPRRMELSNILSEWLITPTVGNDVSRTQIKKKKEFRGMSRTPLKERAFGARGIVNLSHFFLGFAACRDSIKPSHSKERL